MITAQLTDIGADPMHIGMTACARQGMEMVTRKLKSDDGNKGILIYGYKFRPVMAAAV